MNLPKKTAPDQKPPYWEPCDYDTAPVRITCPNGHIGLLHNDSHSIDAHGSVSPSCVCPRDGCTFHEWVLLEGWKR